MAELKRQLRLAHLKIRVPEEKLRLLGCTSTGRRPSCLGTSGWWPARRRISSALGAARGALGYEISEQLDVEPTRYFVLATKREKRACPRCPEAGVVVAPAPSRIVDKRLASDRVVIGTVVAKYVDHLPLYRQSLQLEGEAGVEIHRATLDG